MFIGIMIFLATVGTLWFLLVTADSLTRSTKYLLDIQDLGKHFNDLTIKLIDDALELEEVTENIESMEAQIDPPIAVLADLLHRQNRLREAIGNTEAYQTSVGKDISEKKAKLEHIRKYPYTYMWRK